MLLSTESSMKRPSIHPAAPVPEIFILPPGSATTVRPRGVEECVTGAPRPCRRCWRIVQRRIHNGIPALARPEDVRLCRVEGVVVENVNRQAPYVEPKRMAT